MKVYILWKLCVGSSDGIIGVFSSREKAERAGNKIWGGSPKDWIGYEAIVLEKVME